MLFLRSGLVRNWAGPSRGAGRPGRMQTGQNAVAILGSRRRAGARRRVQCERGLVVAALETLCDLPLQGRRVAVLGDMAELGAQSEAAHAEVGRRAAELGIGQLFAVGKMCAGHGGGARRG